MIPNLINKMINMAIGAPKKLQAKIVADTLIILTVANSTPQDWKSAKPILVEVNVPEEVAKLFKVYARTLNTPVADIESAFINECVFRGMTDQAKRAKKLADKYMRM